MPTSTERTPVPPPRPHTSAVVVVALLGAVVVLLIGISVLVEGPVPVTPGSEVVPAITPPHPTTLR